MNCKYLAYLTKSEKYACVLMEIKARDDFRGSNGNDGHYKSFIERRFIPKKDVLNTNYSSVINKDKSLGKIGW